MWISKALNDQCLLLQLFLTQSPHVFCLFYPVKWIKKRGVGRGGGCKKSLKRGEGGVKRYLNGGVGGGVKSHLNGGVGGG